MRASVMPGISAMPARTISSWITPPVGLAIVITWRGCPLRSTSAISASGMPSSTSRWRDAAASAASPVARTARYSCCAPAHSGTSTSTSGAPAAITSPAARA